MHACMHAYIHACQAGKHFVDNSRSTIGGKYEYGGKDGKTKNNMLYICTNLRISHLHWTYMCPKNCSYHLQAISDSTN